MNVGEIYWLHWLTDSEGKVRCIEAQEGQAAKKWKKEDAKVRKSEAEEAIEEIHLVNDLQENKVFKALEKLK